MKSTRFAIRNNQSRSQQSRQKSRKVNNTAPPSKKKDAAELEVSEELQAAIFETDNHDKKAHVKREYRNRIRQIYNYWMEHLPKYAYKTKKNGTFALDCKKERMLAGIRKVSKKRRIINSCFITTMTTISNTTS